jgi:hypothetical protein
MPTLFAPMETVISPAKDNLDRPYLDRPGKAAAVLAWVSGLLAIPGAFFGAIGVFLIIPPILFVLGTVLLFGYVQEAKGKAQTPNFWGWSVIYNLLLLTATLIIWLAYLGALDVEQHLILLLAANWQATAIHLSKRAMANPNDCRERQATLPITHKLGKKIRPR